MKTFVLLMMAKVDDLRYLVPYIVDMKLTAVFKRTYPPGDL